MHMREYARNLKSLAYLLKPFLIDRAQGILHEQASKLIVRPRKGRDGGAWRIVIDPKNPLVFKDSSEGKVKLFVDLSGVMEGDGDFSLNKYNLLLRLWSCKKEISFREKIDASEIKVGLEGQQWRRVMVRFHIDKKSKKSPSSKEEPIYHLHVGGISHDEEHCWFPKQIEEPRFSYFPMDLVLMSEFILMNFFPKESKDLRKKPEWKSLIRKSQ